MTCGGKVVATMRREYHFPNWKQMTLVHYETGPCQQTPETNTGIFGGTEKCGSIVPNMHTIKLVNIKMVNNYN